MDEMTFEVKTLQTGDLHAFRQLIDVFSVAFDDTASLAAAPAGDAYLQRLLAKPDFIVVVAQVKGRVVGGLTAYVLEKYESERSEVYIYDLAVDERHRRKGMATAVIGSLCKTARGLGASAVFVQADPVDGPAVALYTRLGIREDVLHFDLLTN